MKKKKAINYLKALKTCASSLLKELETEENKQDDFIIATECSELIFLAEGVFTELIKKDQANYEELIYGKAKTPKKK